MNDENTKISLVNVEDGITPELQACIREGARSLTEGYELEIPPQMPPAHENGQVHQIPSEPMKKQTLPNFGRTGW